jgi:hypothetical protein
LNNAVKVPEAVTDTITTQWPEPQVPAEGLIDVLQTAEVVVPPLSQPQEVDEVTAKPVCPLF